MRDITRKPKAQRDLIEIADYIAKGSMNSSDRFLQATERAFKQLADMPGLGISRDYNNPEFVGIRRWPVPGFDRYLIFYRATIERLDVLRVLHGARDLDSIFAPEEDEEDAE